MREGESLPTGAITLSEPDTVRTEHRAAIMAGCFGWLLDAFDFFLVTFCLTAIAREFHNPTLQSHW